MQVNAAVANRRPRTEQPFKPLFLPLHVVDPVVGGAKRLSPLLRRKFDRAYIVNGGFDLDSANAAIRNDEADLIAFGISFLANPDLPQRFRIEAPLNVPDQATFYAGEDKGFTDYPALA
jgi:N-ethylmaleimide reductase